MARHSHSINVSQDNSCSFGLVHRHSVCCIDVSLCLSLFFIPCFLQSIWKDAFKIIHSVSSGKGNANSKIVLMVNILLFRVLKALIGRVVNNCSKLVQKVVRIFANFMEIAFSEPMGLGRRMTIVN